MNPLTKVKLINELNEREAHLGIDEKVSWHMQYKDSAWIFVGGLHFGLTEGDIICVFSQYGEIVNINLVRNKKTGKSRGFCFICYEDQRSSILAVDNFNGIQIKGRTLLVDHVSSYSIPKDSDDIDELTKHLREEGCAPKSESPSSSESSVEDEKKVSSKKHKKGKKGKKKKEKKEKKKMKRERSRSRDQNSESRPSVSTVSVSSQAVQVKRERLDPGYDKYVSQSQDAFRHLSTGSRSDRKVETQKYLDDEEIGRSSKYSKEREAERSSRITDKGLRDERHRDSRPDGRRQDEWRDVRDGHSSRKEDRHEERNRNEERTYERYSQRDKYRSGEGSFDSNHIRRDDQPSHSHTSSIRNRDRSEDYERHKQYREKDYYTSGSHRRS